MRSALVAAAIGASLLALPGAAVAAVPTTSDTTATGRLLVTLKQPPSGATAHASALHAGMRAGGGVWHDGAPEPGTPTASRWRTG